MRDGNEKKSLVTQSIENSQRSRGRRETITVLIIVIILVIFFYLIRGILLPFVLAGIVAYVCTPLVDWLTARTAWPRWVHAILILITLLAFTAIFSYLGIPSLLRLLERIGADAQGAIEGLVRQLIGNGQIQLLGQSISAAQIASYAVNGLRKWFSEDRIFEVVAFGFVGLFGFILTWVLLGYFLIGGPSLAKSMVWLVPPQNRDFVRRVWDDLHNVLWRYFVGVALVVLYASTVAYIGLALILGIHHAVFLALLTGVLEIIPIVGPLASAVIAGLVAVQEATSAQNIIAYIIYASALRISIDEFFGPIVLGRAAYMPPAVVIFCFLAGGILFNITGIIMAIPVALTIKAILYELYKESDIKLVSRPHMD
jgi:predicted PurR-regulated permease PerM